MTEQLPLEGIEHPYIVDLHDAGLFRRESDRTTGCTRLTDTAGRHSCSDDISNGIFPVTIFTLGRFSLLVSGKPADFGRKTPKRPLDLLKAIIAQGGREISISRLASLLWPDVDGDKAMCSFNTTLHRLRKILRDNRVLALRDGYLSLDARYCWVDVWTFEGLLGGVKRVLRDAADSNQTYLLKGFTENLLALYQDHFMARDEMTSWSVSMRERLRRVSLESITC